MEATLETIDSPKTEMIVGVRRKWHKVEEGQYATTLLVYAQEGTKICKIIVDLTVTKRKEQDSCQTFWELASAPNYEGTQGVQPSLGYGREDVLVDVSGRRVIACSDKLKVVKRIATEEVLKQLWSCDWEIGIIEMPYTSEMTGDYNPTRSVCLCCKKTHCHGAENGFEA